MRWLSQPSCPSRQLLGAGHFRCSGPKSYQRSDHHHSFLFQMKVYFEVPDSTHVLAFALAWDAQHLFPAEQLSVSEFLGQIAVFWWLSKAFPGYELFLKDCFSNSPSSFMNNNNLKVFLGAARMPYWSSNSMWNAESEGDDCPRCTCADSSLWFTSVMAYSVANSGCDGSSSSIGGGTFRLQCFH